MLTATNFQHGAEGAMFEILAVLALLVSLAKKPKRRRRSMANYVKGGIDDELQLGTLGGRTLVSIVTDETMIEKGFISSLVATWSLTEFTTASDDGPILCGVAHSDYSDAEIEAFIENANSWNIGDKINQEIAKRLVRVIGTFRATPSATLGAAVLNDGKPIKTKLNWTLITGAGLRFWGYNLGSSALSTGAKMFVQGHANIFLK